MHGEKEKAKRHSSTKKVRKHILRCRTVATICALINIMIYGTAFSCRFEYLIYYSAAIERWDARCNASNIRQSVIYPTFNHGQQAFSSCSCAAGTIPARKDRVGRDLEELGDGSRVGASWRE